MLRNSFEIRIEIIWQMLVMTGGIYIIVAAMNINVDLLHCYHQKNFSLPLRIISITVAVASAGIYLSYFNLKEQTTIFSKLAQIGHFESFGSIIFFIAGMLFMLLSILVFNKRISYLE